MEDSPAVNVALSAESSLDLPEALQAPMWPVGYGFMLLLTAAGMSLYILYAGIGALLLPYQIGLLDAAHKVTILSFFTSITVLIALFANPIAGAFSDRTTSRFGRRRPWILLGGLLTVVGLLFMWRASSIPLLFIGYCVVELFSNCVLAALTATIPDQVPENQRGAVSGIFGLATSLGGILGAILAGQIFKSAPTNAYVVMFLIVLVTTIPFALLLRDKVLSKGVDVQALFDMHGRTAIITGGSGHLGRAMASALARAGARVAILGRHVETAQAVARSIQSEGGTALGIVCDVLSRSDLEQSREQITSAFGAVDIVINAAGGNSPAATTSDEQSFFDLDTQAANRVFGLNFTGTFQSCQVFGRDMAERREGCIVNITSMSGLRPPDPCRRLQCRQGRHRQLHRVVSRAYGSRVPVSLNRLILDYDILLIIERWTLKSGKGASRKVFSTFHTPVRFFIALVAYKGKEI